MSDRRLRVVLLGLSVTSSWGNGHATNYRALMKALTRRGHSVTFLERDVEWYASNRDLPEPPWGRTHLYSTFDELRDVHAAEVAEADLVVIGSYVPDGVAVGRWATTVGRGVTAFYDIDTPVTLAALERDECAYMSPDLVGRFDLYLSFTGGPTLERLEGTWGARAARPFYCMVDEDAMAPADDVERRWELGYLGTYSSDRQPTLSALLLEPARRRPGSRFAVAGPQYPDTASWPDNVDHLDHLAPDQHAGFYGAQRFTVNVTRADMVHAGWSPSVRLFEAGAAGVPIISDRWAGIEHFFRPGHEILLADTTQDVLTYLDTVDDDARDRIAGAARAEVLRSHTAAHRVEELEGHVADVLRRRARL